MFLDVCDLYRFRILNSVDRGHITSEAAHLTAALKIIMHTNYLHTRDHPQRFHQPLDLELDEAEAADAVGVGPANPDRGTGFTCDDFNIGDMVSVWYMRSWWHAKLLYKARAGTLTVRLTGARDRMTGILPKHVKPA